MSFYFFVSANLINGYKNKHFFFLLADETSRYQKKIWHKRQHPDEILNSTPAPKKISTVPSYLLRSSTLSLDLHYTWSSPLSLSQSPLVTTLVATLTTTLHHGSNNHPTPCTTTALL
jgi:hypothetical protein